MRAFILLSAIVLLALLTQAEPLQGTAEEVSDQDEAGAEEQGDVAVSFDEEKRSVQEASDTLTRANCYCRRKSCIYPEKRVSKCKINGVKFYFCCR